MSKNINTEGLIDFSMENTTGEHFVRIHTETLLITLPTPDFSMPYNVICLACTVVAIAFGSIHNLTTRRFVLLDPTKKKGLKNKIKDLIAKLRGKKSTVEEEKVETIKNYDAADDKSDNSVNDSHGEESEDSEIQFNFKETSLKKRKR